MIKILVKKNFKWEKTTEQALQKSIVVSYTETVEPVPVPKSPSSKIPIPWKWYIYKKPVSF